MDSNSRKRQECNFYKKNGFCRKGTACKYLHIIDKPNVIQELFTQLDISKKPAKNVRVGLDIEKQRELRQFLKSYIPNDKRGVIEEHYYEDVKDNVPSDDELTEEEKCSEHEKLMEEKYKHIPDGDFKRIFLQNIMGNFRASKGIPRNISCALERDPRLDYDLKIRLVDQMQKSGQMMQNRARLPIYKSKEHFLDLIKNNQVVVISGETGSGKTTQVAQYILDDYILNNRGSICHIVCTQPRRISAVSVAQRVADERGEKCGESVGYQIRLDKQLPQKQGSILYCTTGILLKWLHSDPGLSHVTHILIDEIHERNMDTDFVMTVIRELLPQRKDLRVVLMSATLNAKQFAEYFYKCPIINVPGQLFPVEEYYLEDILAITGYVNLTQRRSRSLQDANYNDFCNVIAPYVYTLRGKFGDLVIQQLLEPNSEKTNLELLQELIEHICMKKGPGAILVFLPGWDQISELCRKLSHSSFFSLIGVPSQTTEEETEEEDFDNDETAEKREIKILSGISGRQFLIIPLHSKMPTVNQSQVFDPPPPGVRKIIISTNIAETSITINDVVFIIDSGKMKVKTYDPEKNVFVLQDHWVSKANAVQRRGRAGRVQQGECYRLYTRAREQLFEDFPKPEILRSRLEELILTIKLLELGNVSTILNRIMDSPETKIVNSSLKLLETLRALDCDENLTPLGFHLAKLPLEPHIAKMILLAAIFSCVDPILSLAACLSFKEPFFMPLGQDKEVIAKKIAISKGNKSDHLVLAEAFRLWEEAPSKNQARKFCKKNFLSMATLRDLRKLKIEFAENLYSMKFLTTNNTKDESANRNSENFSVLKAVICAGLYPNIAIVERTQSFALSGKMEVVLRTPEDGNVKLHKSSINESQMSFESPYLVYHSKMKSSHVFLHNATMVSSLPLILFSHKVYYDPMEKIIRINNDISFNCEKDLATLVQELRQEVQKVLDALIMAPETVDWMSNDQKTNILRAAAKLMTSEDTTEQNPVKGGTSKESK